MNKFWFEFVRLVRFGLVGGSSAVVYATVLLSLVHFLGTGSVVSSALAFVAAIPVSFFGQKYFTFQSQGTVKRELPAYLLLQGVNLIASVFVTYTVVDLFGMSHFFGILAVVIVITMVSYAAMALAIFG